MRLTAVPALQVRIVPGNRMRSCTTDAHAEAKWPHNQHLKEKDGVYCYLIYIFFLAAIDTP